MRDSIWSKEELIAYILLFAAHSNFEEANKERNVILSKVDMNTFQQIHDEFDKDNDYQSLQKIKEGILRHDYSPQDLNELFNDIKIMFYSDGDYDVLEQNMFLYLKKILS